MSSPAFNSAASDGTTSLAAVFWTRLFRYRALLRRRWWVLLLAVSLALCVQAWRVTMQPPSYSSTGKVIMDGKVTVATNDTGNQYNPLLTGDFQKTIIGTISSQRVRERAWELIEAREGGGGPASPVDLDVIATGTIFTISATGTDPSYTQKYLQATMDAFLAVRRDIRDERLGESRVNVNEEIQRLDKELKADDEAIIQYQREQSLVTQKGDENPAAKELATLRAKLYQLKLAAESLELQDPDKPASARSLDLSALAGSDSPGSGADAAATPSQRSGGGGNVEDSMDGDVRQARQLLVKLQSEFDDLGRDLKPRHPKMIALKFQVDEQHKLLDNLLKQNTLKNKDHLALIRSLIARTEQEIEKAQQETLRIDLIKARLDQLHAKQDRDLAHYNMLETSASGLRTASTVDSDLVSILEKASAPVSIQPSWIKVLGLGLLLGLAAGVGILILLDRIDDRMGSFSDFQAFFSEPVIGQIPRDLQINADLLKVDDARHQLVESYRNIRSSLLYMPLDGARPKTLLISSAVPNEGKSTIATNMALIMAFAGMKTLLIDGDLRRGAIHEAFGLQRGTGLTDVLARGAIWQEAVRPSGIEHLDFMSRGRNVPQPSELLLNSVTDDLIRDLYPLYEYIIIDSSPVLAADDTASVAPKIDAVLFVVRLAFTSAKMVRKSLEILDKRQANIPGVILNFVDTNSPEFVYYQYPEYYHSPSAETGEPAISGKAR